MMVAASAFLDENVAGQYIRPERAFQTPWIPDDIGRRLASCDKIAANSLSNFWRG